MAVQGREKERAICSKRDEAQGRADDVWDTGSRDANNQTQEARKKVKPMGVPILCPVCGKKLGERTKSRIDVRHKGREISFVPAQKSTVKLRCDNKKCKTLYCFSMEGLDKNNA